MTLRPSVAGCSRTHFAVTLGDWSDPLDPDAETQMVYRQLLLGRDQLRWVPCPSQFTPYDQLGWPATHRGLCCSSGHSLHVHQLSLWGAGDELMARTGSTLGRALRHNCILASFNTWGTRDTGTDLGRVPSPSWPQGHCYSVTEVYSNQPRLSGVETKTGTQTPALSCSLSTSRIKFLEDFNVDSSPEADPGEEGSGATEGKRLRRSLSLASSATSHNLPSTSLCHLSF